jgi:hypothetical protein
MIEKLMKCKIPQKLPNLLNFLLFFLEKIIKTINKLQIEEIAG